MARSCRAGQLAQQADLINIGQLVALYYSKQPNIAHKDQQVQFGTSGHRGSALTTSFNEQHILAITQAIVNYRKMQGITGPCFVGKDTHALSEAAFITVLQVLTANNVTAIVQQDNGFTPTPAISHCILNYNQQRTSALADGIIITPSHNPPDNGGIKYNFTNGGPSDTSITQEIEQNANQMLANSLKDVQSQPLDAAWLSGFIVEQDFCQSYVEQLINVIDMKAIQSAKLKIGVDPLGGAGIEYWKKIAEYYQLDITLVNEQIDPSFRFMPLDHDGIIRMDCSSPDAMSGLLALKDSFDLSLANDPDYDRHGIVTTSGLMKPNNYLTVAIDYLFNHRSGWSKSVAIGKTLVSSAMIDKVAHNLGRQLIEVPVGFKWFVDGLYQGQLGFAGEESAGASFLTFNGAPWSTDKDGIIMCLLAAEIYAVTGHDPQWHYERLAKQFGQASYRRLQAPATHEQKVLLSQLSPDIIQVDYLAGDKITACLTRAPGNNASIGGLKVTSDNGWFAARPSGTENAYKIYCESLISDEHRCRIEQEAIEIVDSVLHKKI